MKKLNTVILLLILTILIKPNITRSTINSIILTPANPTNLSTGLGYYLAGRTYNFDIQVIDPDVTAWTDFVEVRLTIPSGTPLGASNIVVRIHTFLAGPAFTTQIVSGNVNCGAGATIIAGTMNNFTVRFPIQFQWNTPGTVWAAITPITARAESNNPANNSLTTTQNVSYGVSSSIKVLNFAQDGVAAGGYVNQYHTGFNVTGRIVYNVPGAGIADDINNITNNMTSSAGTNLSLLLNGVASGITFTPAAASTSFSFIVPGATVTGLGSNNWRVTATMNAAFGGGSSTSPGLGNYLLLNCDEVQINQVQFINGGGIDNPSNLGVSTSRTYYRARNLPGTQIRVYAQMLSGPNVIGNTTVRVRDITEGLNYDVVIPNNTAYGDLPLGMVYGTDNNYPNTPAAGNTLLHTYQVTNISGGATGNEQNLYGRINQPGRPIPGGANTVVYWNNLHWPSTTPNVGAGLAFYDTTRNIALGVNSTSYTASSITLNWTLTGAAAVPPNGDFSSYKIYYKRVTPALPPDLWHIVDVSTIAALGTITTNTATITSLAPLTAYQYYFSAYDVFGNEPAQLSNQPTGTITTAASTVTATVTDGITTYPYTSFLASATTSKDPALLPLRKTAIKISVSVVSGGTVPDEVSIFFANNSTDVITSSVPGPATNQFGTVGIAGGQLTVDSILFAPTYYTIVLSKTAPNTWSGYIPSDHVLMVLGTSIRFIIGTKYGAVYSYVDLKGYNNPTNWWDAEYRFQIASQPTFQPWPVRILNNVMNAENPICYPAYYLTEDAYVTISVFDVKGRPVVTLLDNQLRRGGQNIKEGGWDGSNKATRKIGVGIYYVRFYAARAADGKVILNEFRKVVMAR